MFTLVEKEPVKIRFILAGSLQQARDWMSANRQNPNDWKYIYQALDLAGRINGEFICVGSFSQRKDYLEIIRFLNERGFKEISISAKEV